MTNLEYLKCLDADEMEEFLSTVYSEGFFEAMCGDVGFCFTADWLESEFNEEEFWGGVEQ